MRRMGKRRCDARVFQEPVMNNFVLPKHVLCTTFQCLRLVEVCPVGSAEDGVSLGLDVEEREANSS